MVAAAAAVTQLFCSRKQNRFDQRNQRKKDKCCKLAVKLEEERDTSAAYSTQVTLGGGKSMAMTGIVSEL